MVSRGALNEGVTTGLDMLSFILLHLSVTEPNPQLVDSFLVGVEAEILPPEQWFSRGHTQDGGYYDERKFL
jgi:hypothetical protein